MMIRNQITQALNGSGFKIAKLYHLPHDNCCLREHLITDDTLDHLRSGTRVRVVSQTDHREFILELR
jgi:hypothetical protein